MATGQFVSIYAAQSYVPQDADLIQFLNGTGPLPYIQKPTGYSLFPYELFPMPGSAAKAAANLVFYKRHERGGHFAVSRVLSVVAVYADRMQAMEKPEELLADVEEWIPKAWKAGNGKL